jgi:glycosyltransferase involved in cell wall biosynthesis
MKRPKLLYLITEDWFFCSHFIERALAAKTAGYDVVLVAREQKHGELIRASGLRLIPLKMQRGSINPFNELKTLLSICKIYLSERPDIVHHVALKPILYGSLVARIAGIKRIVNAPVGMGYIFTSKDFLASLLRPIVSTAMRVLLNPQGSKVVFENGDDLSNFVSDKVVKKSDAVLIRGAGVNVDQYKPQQEEPSGVPSIVLVARMLWDKGIAEFVEAACILQSQSIKARFILVGAPDTHNRAAISLQQLNTWQQEGLVEWLGHQEDIPAILAACHIVCLPSYREGLPKSLLEALAAGKPVVTTDVPGCREVVKNQDNGFLVPARDSRALAQALAKLVNNSALRAQFGLRGRLRAESEFSSAIVIDSTLALYKSMFPATAGHRLPIN